MRRFSYFTLFCLGICLLVCLDTVNGGSKGKKKDGKPAKSSKSSGGNPFSLSSSMKRKPAKSSKSSGGNPFSLSSSIKKKQKSKTASKGGNRNPFSLGKNKSMKNKKKAKPQFSLKPKENCKHCFGAKINIQLRPKPPPVDPKCPNTQVINCLSCKFRYRDCPVFAAESIINVTCLYSYRETKCRNKKEYGFKGRNVWVKDGCRARFKVCYKKGDPTSKADEYKNVPCQCNVNGAGKKCPMQLTRSQHVADVVVLAQYSSKQCVKKKNYGFSEKDNKIWVDKGCGAMFRVYIRG